MELLALTLESIVVERPDGIDEGTQNLCLDKGYDNPTGHRAVAAYGYRGHIRRETGRPGRETLLGLQLSKCRAILVRYDKKESNYRSNWPAPCSGTAASGN